MAQVLQDKGWIGGLADILGQTHHNALSGLVQGKLEGMQQQQQRQQFMNQLQQGGYSEPQAQLAQVFQNNPKELLSLLGALSQGGGAEGLQGNQPGMAENQGNFGQQMVGNQGNLQNLMAGNQGPQSGMQNLQDILNQFAQQTKPQEQQQYQPKTKEKQRFNVPKPLTPAQQLFRNPGMTPADARLAAQKDKFEYQKSKDAYEAQKKEQQVVDKEVAPYFQQVNTKGGSAAKQIDATLDRMNKLIDSGKLTGPNMYNFRKKMEHVGHLVGGGLGSALVGGLGAVLGSAAPGVGTLAGLGAGATVGGGIGTAVGAALTPKFVGSKEDQEFQKLSLGFLDKLKDVFGGRISNIELQTYMDSIPALSQTDEGKKAIIRNMKLTTDGWRHKKLVMDKIISQNNGYKPRNLEELVEKESEPYLENLKQKFVEGPYAFPIGKFKFPE